MSATSSSDFFEINKHWLYLIVLSIVFGYFALPRLYYLQTYSRASGKVSGYEEVWVTSKNGGYTKRYPIIEFTTSKYIVKFAVPSYMYEETRSIVDYPVIYDPENPGKAFVLTNLGLWGNSLIYLMIFFLCWTAFIFGVGFLPKVILIDKQFYRKLFRQ